VAHTRPRLMSMDPSAAGSLPSPCASLPLQLRGYFARDYDFPARGGGSGCPLCRDAFSRMLIFEHVLGWSLACRLQYCGMHAAACDEITDHICGISPHGVWYYKSRRLGVRCVTNPGFLSHTQCELRRMDHPLHPVNAMYPQQLAPCATAAALSAL
jgi:hypothetical protein